METQLLGELVQMQLDMRGLVGQMQTFPTEIREMWIIYVMGGGSVRTRKEKIFSDFKGKIIHHFLYVCFKIRQRRRKTLVYSSLLLNAQTH